MSGSDFKGILDPKLRPAFGLIAGLVGGAAAVLFALARFDAHVEAVAHHALDPAIAACSTANAAAAAALEQRVKAIEDDRSKSANSRVRMQDQIDGLRTDVAVLKATPRR